MKQYIKEISKHSLIYTISNFLTKATGLILIPIYTRYLTTSDYGIVSNVLAIINFLSVLYIFGMNAVWGRFFFDFKDKSIEQKRFFGSTLYWLFFGGLILNVLMSYGSKGLFFTILPDLDFYPFVLLAIWTALFSVAFNLKLTLFRVRQQSLQFGLISFGRFLLTVIVTIYAVAILHYGAFGKVFAQFAVWGLFFLIALYLLKKDLVFSLNNPKLKQALKYTLGVLPHSLSGSIMNIIDRVILTNIKGLAATGIYTVGFQFGSIMQLIVFSFNLSWTPFFMKTAQQKGAEAKQIFSRLSTYYVIVMYIIALSITLFGADMVYLFTTRKYFGAINVIPIYVFNFVIYGFYFMASAKIFYIKKAVKYLALITFSTAGINIIFNFLLIPEMGMMGAAWARFISSFSLFIIVHFVSQKFYYIPYEYKKILGSTAPLVIVLIAFFLGQPLFAKSYFLLVVFKITLIGLYLLYLHVTRLFTIKEGLGFLKMFKK